MCVHICVYVYVCIHMYTCVLYMRVCLCIYDVCMDVYVCTHGYVCVYMYVYNMHILNILKGVST